MKIKCSLCGTEHEVQGVAWIHTCSECWPEALEMLRDDLKQFGWEREDLYYQVMGLEQEVAELRGIIRKFTAAINVDDEGDLSAEEALDYLIEEMVFTHVNYNKMIEENDRMRDEVKKAQEAPIVFSGGNPTREVEIETANLPRWKPKVHIERRNKDAEK